MRTISHSKHTKLKNTKIYSKGILVNHTKISTNENFPLYGKEIYYRIASNLMDISNYPDTISNYFFTSNYTGQSMKFEFLLLIIRTSLDSSR